MKTWIENNFSIRYLTNTNIKDLGVYIYTPYSNIKDDYKECFDVDLDDEEDDCNVCVSYAEVDAMLDDIFNIEYTDWFDDLEYEDFICQLTKSYPHYLVCAYHSNWRGDTGYKIATTMCEALGRSYDTSMYVIGASKMGKSILINESSHDVPMGSNTIVIGLTEKEFDKLNKMCYNNIIEFADGHYNSIIRF